MKYLFSTFLTLCLFSSLTFAQGVSISPDASPADNSAMFDVKSTTKGLLLPRMTQVQRVAITSPATGLIVYQTDASAGFYYYNGTAWQWLSNPPIIQDADADTKIEVEKITNEDKIRFSLGGTERFRMNRNSLECINAEESVFIGNESGLNNLGLENVGIGTRALRNLTIGYGNVAVGLDALKLTTTGFSNTALGNGTLVSNNGASNVAVGRSAGGSNTVGNGNTFLGVYTGFDNVNGSGNVFIGFEAGTYETGSNKLYITNTDDTTPLIYGEFDNNLLRINGTLNVNNAYSLPTNAGTANQILQTNGAGVASWVSPSSLSITESDPKVGTLTTNYLPKWNGTSLINGQVFDSGTNVGIGTTSPADKLHVVGNTRIDAGRLEFRNTGESVFIGENAGFNDDLVANKNVFVGHYAGFFNTSGNHNTFIGNRAGWKTNTGSLNTGVGQGALANNTTGGSNVAVGWGALSDNTIGSNNTSIGEKALNKNVTGVQNVAVGTQSLFGNLQSNNVAIGYEAGYSNVNGTGNVFLGHNAGYNETGSEKLYIDNSNTTNPLIYGDFNDDYVSVNNQLGIGTGTTSLPFESKLVVSSIDANEGGQIQLNKANAFYTTYFLDVYQNLFRIMSGTDVASNTVRLAIDSTGKVGIGTDEPTEKLEVVGKTKTTNFQMTTGATNGFVLQSDASGNGSWVNSTTLDITENDPKVGTLTNNYLPKWDGTSLANGLLFDDGQRLAVGTTNTNYGNNFDYAKIGIISEDSDYTDFNNILVEDSGFAPWINFGKARGTIATKTAVQNDDQLVVLNGNGYDGTNFISSATFEMGVDGAVSAGVVPSRITFSTTEAGNTSASERMRINNAGNVGIGTASPTEKLDVAGKTKTTTLQMTTGAANGYTLASDVNGNASWSSNLYNNGINVGIGTTSPADKLHVVGKLRIDAGKIDFRNTGESVFIGQDAGLNDDLTTNQNTYVGFEAGKTGITANKNVGMGYKALSLNTSTDNTAIGANAMANSTGAFQNVAIGSNAMLQSTGGNYNVAIGSDAFRTNTIGDNNVIVGYEAGRLSTGNGNVFIGNAAGYNETSNQKLYIDNTSTTTPLIWGDFAADYVNINGNLGIGTTSPTTAKLVVNGTQNNNIASYAYLNSAGSILSSGGSSLGYSIYASSRIAASEIQAFSDARIKKITGRTNNAQDLATLANIKITDYKHIDSIAKGNKEIKKVIAQELKTVYPQAVSTMTDVVPDIYQQASIENGFVALPTNLKASEKVKVIFATGEEVLEVTEVQETGFRVNSDKAGKIFVYGRQVDDFHTVDYEALSTLNISATQELLKRLETLENENKNLKTENITMKKGLTDLNEKVEAIYKLLPAPTQSKK